MNDNNTKKPIAFIDPALIEAKVKEQANQDTLGRAASATPLPGPLRDVFAVVPGIPVGPYVVRPFMDIDFEFLQTLDHPLKNMMVNPQVADKFLPTGPAAWELCWMMTNPVGEVDKAFQKGAAYAKAQARERFGVFQLVALQKIIEAVVIQMSIYWSAVLPYGPEGEQGANPTQDQSQPQRTGLVG